MLKERIGEDIAVISEIDVFLQGRKIALFEQVPDQTTTNIGSRKEESVLLEEFYKRIKYDLKSVDFLRIAFDEYEEFENAIVPLAVFSMGRDTIFQDGRTPEGKDIFEEIFKNARS